MKIIKSLLLNAILLSTTLLTTNNLFSQKKGVQRSLPQNNNAAYLGKWGFTCLKDGNASNNNSSPDFDVLLFTKDHATLANNDLGGIYQNIPNKIDKPNLTPISPISFKIFLVLDANGNLSVLDNNNKILATGTYAVTNGNFNATYTQNGTTYILSGVVNANNTIQGTATNQATNTVTCTWVMEKKVDANSPQSDVLQVVNTGKGTKLTSPDLAYATPNITGKWGFTCVQDGNTSNNTQVTSPEINVLLFTKDKAGLTNPGLSGIYKNIENKVVKPDLSTQLNLSYEMFMSFLADGTFIITDINNKTIATGTYTYNNGNLTATYTQNGIVYNVQGTPANTNTIAGTATNTSNNTIVCKWIMEKK